MRFRPWERAVHDRGGWPTNEPIDRTEHELEDCELLTDALTGTVGRAGVMNVDKLQRGIESMPPGRLRAGRLLRALAVLDRDDPDREGDPRPRRARGEAVSFRPGQRVRVATRPHDGHHRTTGYLKGKTASIVRVAGTFTNPETRAHGADGLPEQRLYTVGFAQCDVWPGYTGRAGGRLCVGVYEHLARADRR